MFPLVRDVREAIRNDFGDKKMKFCIVKIDVRRQEMNGNLPQQALVIFRIILCYFIVYILNLGIDVRRQLQEPIYTNR